MSKFTLALSACLIAILGVTGLVLVNPQQATTRPQRVDRIAASLRCPVCESLSVKESTSDVAGEMRARIARQVRAGRSDDDIKDAFVESYGESVLLSPERRGINLVAWVVPVIALLGGGAMTASLLRRWMKPERRAA